MRLAPHSPLHAALPAVLAAAVAVCSAAPAVAAETWILDPDHTEVRFTWDHLGLSRQGGRFHQVTGKATLDAARPADSSLEVRIPLASLSTGVRKLDEHLLSTKEFFDAAAHPEITFRSTAITARGPRGYEITGDLTINGIARPVTLEAVVNFVGDHPLAGINPTYSGFYSAGFSASTQIRRSDWGITRTIPYVSDEIRITVEAELHREGGPPPPGETPALAPVSPAVAESAEPQPAAGDGEAPPAAIIAPLPLPDGLGSEAVDKAP